MADKNVTTVLFQLKGDNKDLVKSLDSVLSKLGNLNKIGKKIPVNIELNKITDILSNLDKLNKTLTTLRNTTTKPFDIKINGLDKLNDYNKKVSELIKFIDSLKKTKDIKINLSKMDNLESISKKLSDLEKQIKKTTIEGNNLRKTLDKPCPDMDCIDKKSKAIALFSNKMAMAGVAGVALGASLVKVFDEIKDAIVAASEDALKFEQKIYQMKTVTQENLGYGFQESAKVVIKAAKDISANATLAAEGIKNTFAAGVGTAEDALIGYQHAQMAAMATQSDMNDLINFGVIANNNYATSVEDWPTLFNKISVAAVSSKLEIKDFAKQGSVIASGFVAANITLDESLALVSSFGNYLRNAAEATVAATNMVKKLIQPTREMKDVIAGINESTKGIGQNIILSPSGIGAIDGTLEGYLKNFNTKMEAYAQENATTVQDVIAKLFKEIRANRGLQVAFGAIFSGEFARIKEAIKNDVDWLKNAYEESLKSILNRFEILSNGISSDFKSLFTAIQPDLHALLDYIEDSVNKIIDFVNQLAKKFKWLNDQGQLTESFKTIAKVFDYVVKTVGSLIADFIWKLTQGINMILRFWDVLTNAFGGIYNTVVNSKKMWEDAKNGNWQAIGDFFDAQISRFNEKKQEFLNATKGFLSGEGAPKYSGEKYINSKPTKGIDKAKKQDYSPNAVLGAYGNRAETMIQTVEAIGEEIGKAEDNISKNTLSKYQYDTNQIKKQFEIRKQQSDDWINEERLSLENLEKSKEFLRNKGLGNLTKSEVKQFKLLNEAYTNQEKLLKTFEEQYLEDLKTYEKDKTIQIKQAQKERDDELNKAYIDRVNKEYDLKINKAEKELNDIVAIAENEGKSKAEIAEKSNKKLLEISKLHKEKAKKFTKGTDNYLEEMETASSIEKKVSASRNKIRQDELDQIHKVQKRVKKLNEDNLKAIREQTEKDIKLRNEGQAKDLNNLIDNLEKKLKNENLSVSERISLYGRYQRAIKKKYSEDSDEYKQSLLDETNYFKESLNKKEIELLNSIQKQHDDRKEQNDEEYENQVTNADRLFELNKISEIERIKLLIDSNKDRITELKAQASLEIDINKKKLLLKEAGEKEHQNKLLVLTEDQLKIESIKIPIDIFDKIGQSLGQLDPSNKLSNITEEITGIANGIINIGEGIATANPIALVNGLEDIINVVSIIDNKSQLMYQKMADDAEKARKTVLNLNLSLRQLNEQISGSVTDKKLAIEAQLKIDLDIIDKQINDLNKTHTSTVQNLIDLKNSPLTKIGQFFGNKDTINDIKQKWNSENDLYLKLLKILTDTKQSTIDKSNKDLLETTDTTAGDIADTWSELQESIINSEEDGVNKSLKLLDFKLNQDKKKAEKDFKDNPEALKNKKMALEKNYWSERSKIIRDANEKNYEDEKSLIDKFYGEKRRKLESEVQKEIDIIKSKNERLKAIDEDREDEAESKAKHLAGFNSAIASLTPTLGADFYRPANADAFNMGDWNNKGNESEGEETLNKFDLGLISLEERNKKMSDLGLKKYLYFKNIYENTAETDIEQRRDAQNEMFSGQKQYYEYAFDKDKEQVESETKRAEERLVIKKGELTTATKLELAEIEKLDNAYKDSAGKFKTYFIDATRDWVQWAKTEGIPQLDVDLNNQVNTVSKSLAQSASENKGTTTAKTGTWKDLALPGESYNDFIARSKKEDAAASLTRLGSNGAEMDKYTGQSSNFTQAYNPYAKGAPTFHQGGTMPYDGIANLRAGERVLDPYESRNYNSNSKIININPQFIMQGEFTDKNIIQGELLKFENKLIKDIQMMVNA